MKAIKLLVNVIASLIMMFLAYIFINKLVSMLSKGEKEVLKLAFIFILIVCSIGFLMIAIGDLLSLI